MANGKVENDSGRDAVSEDSRIRPLESLSAINCNYYISRQSAVQGYLKATLEATTSPSLPILNNTRFDRIRVSHNALSTGSNAIASSPNMSSSPASGCAQV